MQRAQALILVVVLIIIAYYVYSTYGSSSTTVTASAVTPAAVAPTVVASAPSTPSTLSTPLTATGCDYSAITAQCPSGKVINVTGGFYGRRNSTTCPGTGTATSANCQASNIVTALGGMLNGKSSGSFNVLPGSYAGGIVGVNDPCPGVTKEFELDYTCN